MNPFGKSLVFRSCLAALVLSMFAVLALPRVALAGEGYVGEAGTGMEEHLNVGFEAAEPAEGLAEVEGPLAEPVGPDDSDALGADEVASGEWGECSWSIDWDGLLRIWPTNGKSGRLADSRGYDSSLPDSDVAFPWYKLHFYVKRVTIDSGVLLPSDCSYMFYNCRELRSIDVSGWDTSSVTDMSDMFSSCSSLTSLDVSGWDTSSVTDMSFVFYYCSSLTSLDVSGWDTSSVTNICGLFEHCSSLSSLDLSGWDTSSVADMSFVFCYCFSLTSLDVSGWDTSKVTNMANIFTYCSSIRALDVSKWDTSNVTSLDGAFADCSSLEILDVSDWDTSQVTSMWLTFIGCSSIETLDVSGWDTSKVKNMDSLFSGCSALRALDLSKWDTSSLYKPWKYEEMSDDEGVALLPMGGGTGDSAGKMFENCSSLARISVGENFCVDRAFPAATSETGKWHSLRDGLWLTVEEIQSSRVGIADTYTSTVPTQEMHRLYNPNSGEHFYTASTVERDALKKLGWKYEGVGWVAPVSSKTPVYRLYNANAGDHHYTTSEKERDALVRAGWKHEAIGWYSDDDKGAPLYRQYNPNAVAGSHNYTTSKQENDALVNRHGWKAEGIGWYGVKQ